MVVVVVVVMVAVVAAAAAAAAAAHRQTRAVVSFTHFTRVLTPVMSSRCVVFLELMTGTLDTPLDCCITFEHTER